MMTVFLQLPFLAIILIAAVLSIMILFVCKNLLHLKQLNTIWIFISIIYGLSLYAILLSPSVLYSNEPINTNYFQLIPLKSINNFISNSNYLPILAGVIIFIPITIILQGVFRKITFNKICISSLVIVLCVEPVQLMINLITRFPNKVIDIDDIILNVIGLIISMCLLKFVNKYIFKR